MQDVNLFDVVELIVDLPQQGLYAGMCGTVLEMHGAGQAFEVEFSDEQGQVVSFLALPPEHFVVIWRAQERQWVSTPERLAQLVARLPEPVGAEVLDFARFMAVRTHQRSHIPTPHVTR
jgi:hypothetical protein